MQGAVALALSLCYPALSHGFLSREVCGSCAHALRQVRPHLHELLIQLFFRYQAVSDSKAVFFKVVFPRRITARYVFFRADVFGVAACALVAVGKKIVQKQLHTLCQSVVFAALIV